MLSVVIIQFPDKATVELTMLAIAIHGINNSMKIIAFMATKLRVNLADFKIIGDNYTTRGKNASKNFYFGKYMALVFIDAVEASSTSPGNRNGFATDVIRYAQSNIDNVSTYFWKIF